MMAERLRDESIDLPSFLESIFVSPPVREEVEARVRETGTKGDY
jgi:hypothetical protein